MSDTYDAIILGTGQSGPPLAGRLASAGRRVAILERERVGGTCVNWGCIPTKTLVASARAAWVARNAARWGVVVEGDVRVDMARVKERMREISGASNKGVEKWLEGMDEVDLVRGDGRFIGPRKIEVGGRVLEAEQVFINVGGRSRVPEIPGLGEVDFLDNKGILQLEELPEHLIVIGGSYIGLEFAQMYRRFGSRVTVVERGDRLVIREDPDISRAVREILEGEDIEVVTDAGDLSVRPAESGVSVHARGTWHEGTHLLVATGRVPNSDTLNLASAGIQMDDRGYIEVDDELRTSADGVWAIGDVNGRGAFTHTSYNDFEIVAANLLDGEKRRVSDRIPAYALFIDPPLGRVGMNEREARASGRRVLQAVYPMKHVGRAKERSETAGVMKVLVDGDTKEILGASLLGISADEVVHTFIDLMMAGATYDVLLKAVHIHPTVSELLPTALQKLKPLDGENRG